MNTQRLELIRNRREEDDEVFMFLLLTILHYHKSNLHQGEQLLKVSHTGDVVVSVSKAHLVLPIVEQ